MPRGWKCSNCGHVHPSSEDLNELCFKWLGPLTSSVCCANCGSYTIQRAFDDTFRAGYFLMVKAFNKVKGKGGRDCARRTVNTGRSQ